MRIVAKAYKFLFFLAISLVLFHCENSDVSPGPKSDKDLTAFKFEVKNNPQLLADVTCYIHDDKIIGRVLYTNLATTSALQTSFIATFATTGVTVRIDSVVQQSGVTSIDLSKPVTCEIEAEDHSTKKYDIEIFASTGLPVLFVNTENGDSINSKDVYVNGTLGIDASLENKNWNYTGPLQIKGHGNTTWGMPKKPYKIKLSAKAGLLGMPADKEWILLANYDDKTLMRNYLAFEVSNRIGMPYTPRSQYVELFLNGSYQGNYQLTEEIKISSSRVNIAEMDETDVSGSKLTGGYLMEVDTRLDEDFWFVTSRNAPFTIKSPDDILPVQLDYIHSYTQHAEDILFSDSFSDPSIGYAQFIDTDTFIKWYLVNELFKNNDANFNSSVYMYKDKNGKLAMGPVWDFDIAAGNINYDGNDNPEGWWVRTAPWLTRLFEDPAFSQKVAVAWAGLRHNLLSIDPFIDQTAATLKKSQYNNFKKWDILSVAVWPNPVVTGSYQGEVSYLKTWMSKRITWMDAQLSN